MGKFAIPMLIAALFALQACSRGGAGSSGSTAGIKLVPCPKMSSSASLRTACKFVGGKLYIAR